MTRTLDWVDFCAWVQGRVATREVDSYDRTTIDFADGSQAIVISNHDPGYSEYTPGGPECPTVVVQDATL